MANRNITRESSTKIESEKLLERKLNEGVKALGGLCFKFLPFLVAGIPDRICLFPGGRICFVELKSTGKNSRKLQVLMQHKISKLGFDVHEIDTSEQIKNLLKSYE